MLRALGGIAIAAVLAVAANVFNSTTSLALCNQVCMQKCAQVLSGPTPLFPSMKECIEVWSRRNGPTGLGCGKKGERWKSCE